MSLRKRIIITLLPFLLPIVLVILLNYHSQRNAEIEYYLRMASLTILNGAEELTKHFQASNKTFKLITEKVLSKDIDIARIDARFDNDLGLLMQANPAFSALLLTDSSGKVTFFRTNLNDTNKYLMPKDITGASVFTSSQLTELTSTYSIWFSRNQQYRKEVKEVKRELDDFAARGEKNSLQYRTLQNQLVWLSRRAVFPPVRVFSGGRALAVEAGLPFRHDTFIFATSIVDKHHRHVGFFCGLLDWSMIEDKCFWYQSELQFSGIPLGKVRLVLTGSEKWQAGAAEGVKLRLESERFAELRILEHRDMREYSVSAPLMTSEMLDAINSDEALFNNRDWSLKAMSAVGKNELSGALVASLPETNILYHSRSLFTRAMSILLLSILFLIAVIHFLSGRIVMPLKRLAAAAKRLSEGKFEKLYVYDKPDEIGELIHSFNLMGAKLHDAQSALIKQKDELQIATERYRILFDNAPLPIAVSMGDGKIVEVNKALLRAAGRTKETIMKLNAADFYKDSEDRIGFLEDLKTTGVSLNRQLELLRSDKSVAMCRIASASMDIHGEMYIYTMMEDISHQMEIERQLQQKQKMEALGTLAGGIAHDFNNILAVILGYSELVQMQLSSDSVLHSNLDKVIYSANRAKDLVGQILAFSRKSVSLQVLLDPIPVIREAIELIRFSLPSTIEIEHIFDENCGLIEADATQLQQIMMNLCGNSSQAMEENGGRLFINLESVVLIEQDLRGEETLEPGSYVQLTVRDTGPGIDPTIKIERIFDPFYTTKEVGQGTGMGLAVVHGIVKQHRGIIRVSNTPGEGVEFRLYFPELAKKILQTDVDQSSIPTGSERVLFVDDDQMVATMGKQILENLGYTVTVQTDSKEALRMFMQQPDTFDLIITDQTMPEMTGTALVKEILAIKPEIPIILCTGYSRNLSREHALQQGCRGFLMKPVQRKQLALHVRAVLDGSEIDLN